MFVPQDEQQGAYTPNTPPYQQQQPLRHRPAANPSFKIFSPSDMHQSQWGEQKSYQGGYNQQQQDNNFNEKYRSNTSPRRRFLSGKSKMGTVCKYLCLLFVLLLIIGAIAFAYVKWNKSKMADWNAVPGIERLNQQWQERHERMKAERNAVERNAAETLTREVPSPPEVQRVQEETQQPPPRVQVERNRVPRNAPSATETPKPPVEEQRQQQHEDTNPLEFNTHHDEPAAREEELPQHTDNPNEVVTVDDDDMPVLEDETVPNATPDDADAAAQQVPPLHFHPEKPVNISYNEYHQQALHHVLENVLHAPNNYRPKGMTLVHFSSHYDLEVPFILHGSYLRSWKKFSSHVSTRAYLMPLVYLGLVKRIVWVRPSWAKTTLRDRQVYKFNIGNLPESDRLVIDNMDLVKEGLLFTGYAQKSKMEHAKEGELVIVEGDFAVEQVTKHPDALISLIMGITPESEIIFNLDDSYFSAQNPLLNWLNTEESIHHKDFNIHAAINIFNPESYCMEQERDEQKREEFANAFRAFYRTSERSQLAEPAFLRLYAAIKPFWCNPQKIDYAMHNFKLVIHTVLHDEELSRDPELENIVQRLKELNVYPHHVSSEKQKNVLFYNLETLMGMILSKIHKAPFSTSVVLSLRDHLVPETDKNVIMNRVHHMMRRLFGRVKLIKGFDRQVYSFRISPDELRLTEDEDRHQLTAFTEKPKKKNRSGKKGPKREKRLEKLRRQRAEIEQAMHEEARRRAASNGRPRHQDHNDDRPRRGQRGRGAEDYYDPHHDNYASLEHEYEFDDNDHPDDYEDFRRRVA